MIVLVAANSNALVHYLAGKYPGSIGWIMSPATKFFPPKEWLPYCVDNGVYSAWNNQEKWSEESFFSILDQCFLSRFKPRWIVVPDAIGDKELTLYQWNQYEHKLRCCYKTPLAFVAQDGMKLHDVPKSADLVFIGGTTKWKWRNAARFVAQFPRVHVGRVNWWDKLEYCERLDVESCDGSGFFREGDGERSQQLRDFIEGHRRSKEQPELMTK